MILLIKGYQQTGCRILILFLDIEDSFDNIIPAHIQYTIKNSNILQYLINWVIIFIISIKISLFFWHASDTIAPIHRRTAHGSLASPYLFYIFILCFYKYIGKETTIISYIDDFSITVSGFLYTVNSAPFKKLTEDMFISILAINLSFEIPKTELVHWCIIKQRGSKSTPSVTIQGDIFNSKDPIR